MKGYAFICSGIAQHGAREEAWTRRWVQRACLIDWLIEMILDNVVLHEAHTHSLFSAWFSLSLSLARARAPKSVTVTWSPMPPRACDNGVTNVRLQQSPWAPEFGLRAEPCVRKDRVVSDTPQHTVTLRSAKSGRPVRASSCAGNGRRRASPDLSLPREGKGRGWLAASQVLRDNEVTGYVVCGACVWHM